MIKNDSRVWEWLLELNVAKNFAINNSMERVAFVIAFVMMVIVTHSSLHSSFSA